MKVYPDTNFLIQLYLPLLRSQKARLMAREEPGLVLTWLSLMEASNAFERMVFESRHTGQFRITPEAAATAHANLESDQRANFIEVAKPPLPNLTRQFHDLVFRHTARHGFRTYDVLHVASALVLECEAFWSFDTRARQLAEMEGLQVNPMN